MIDTDLFTPSDAEFIRNPYECYREFRRKSPVYRRDTGDWVVTRYRDVLFTLTDQRFGTDANEPDHGDDEDESQGRPGEALWLIDPPRHTVLRGRLSNVLTPHMTTVVARLDDMATALLAQLRSAGTVDFVAGFARPFVSQIAAKLLDLPHGDLAQLDVWAQGLEPLSDLDMNGQTRLRAAIAGRRFTHYFQQLVDERRRRPGHDAISQLAVEERTIDSEGVEYLANQLVLVFIAAHQTTVNSLGNGLYALLRNPGEAARYFGENRRSFRPAVDELLRFESPTQCVVRTARQSVTIGDETIGAGERVLGIVGCANRDDEVFADPDQLDLGRNPNRHLAFAHGPHVCFGRALARPANEAMLRALYGSRIPVDLEDEPQYRAHYVLRGLESLSVSIG